MKLLAVHQGRKLKDVAADLLMRGLKAGQNKPTPGPRQDFLLSAPSTAPDMTPERVREILEEVP